LTASPRQLDRHDRPGAADPRRASASALAAASTGSSLRRHLSGRPAPERPGSTPRLRLAAARLARRLVVCSAWLYVAEHGVNKAIENPFDALWWGVVTLTTVGYGDVTPVTTEGRIAAMALMLLGIGLFGAITATITSYLLSRESVHDPDLSLAGDLERLAALHRQGDLTDEEFAAGKRKMFLVE